MKMKLFLFYGAILVSIIVSNPLKAQDNNPWIDSKQAIQDGLKLNDEGQYDEAIKKYNLVSENDTNYALCLTEKAFTYIENKQFDEAINVCHEGLTLGPEYGNLFYLSLGSAFDDEGKHDSAIKIYNQAIVKYPNDYKLYYNLGITQANLKDYPNALKSYQKALEINPFHPGTNLQLGLLAARCGKAVPAMMAISIYLLLNNEDTAHAPKIAGLLESITRGEPLNDTDLIKGFSPYSKPDDDLDAVEQIVDSRLALEKNYKSKLHISFDMVKQLQVMMEKLKYNANDQDLWMQDYVPLYTYIWQNNYFEPFCYDILYPTKNPEVVKWANSNKSSLLNFQKGIFEKITEQTSRNTVYVNQAVVKMRHWFYGENYLQAIGEVSAKDDKIKTGDWVYFYSNGIISDKGSYSDDGKQDAEWKSYYKNGNLKEICFYKESVRTGKDALYNKNGQLSAEGEIVNGQLDNDLKTYYISGQPKTITKLNNGIKNGIYTSYYESGKKMEEFTYVNNKKNGDFHSWYEDGKPRVSVHVTDDKYDGPYVLLYEDGKISVEGQYKNDVPFGHFKYHYKDGALRQEGDYNQQGNYTGTWKGYDEKGVVTEIIVYESNGDKKTDQQFDRDGKLYMNVTYKSNKIDQVIYYDKSGKVISTSQRTHGLCDVVGYHADGSLSFKGSLKNDKKNGEWTNYYNNGAIKSIGEYTDDDENGPFKTFWGDGSLKEQYTCKDGKTDGYYKSFFENGKLSEEGWYKNGDKDGTWYTYYINGTVESKSFFSSGDINGYKYFYFPNGKLKDAFYYKYTQLDKIINYDTSGNSINTTQFSNGSGAWTDKFFNGNKRIEAQYKFNQLTGPVTAYHADGQIAHTGQYEYGDQNGLWKWYDDKGVETEEGNYLYGNGEGHFIEYEKGKKILDSYYTDDVEDSTWKWYYPSGAVEQTRQYQYGERDGKTIKYNEEGKEYVQLNYSEGILLSYTYLGPDGKNVPDILLKNESGLVTAYFPNGKKSFEVTYKNGYYDVAYKTYYENGNLREEVPFKNHGENGEDKKYSATNQLVSDEQMVDGKKDGISTFYYDNGKPEHTEFYIMGDKYGTWNYYDRAGKLIKTEHYYDDELLN